jgi:hypothetical protein
MSWKFAVVMYLLIPVMLSFFTYAALLDLVGEILAFGAGACVATLWFISFCNLIDLPIRWDK